MYAKSIHVKNLKRLRDFTLDFTHEGKPRMWTMLIGENGTAKTTLLQAIALAAAGSKQVNTLASPVVKYLRDRRGEDEMSISVDFDFTPHSLEAAAEIHSDAPKNFIKSLGLRSNVNLSGDSTSLNAKAWYVDLASRQNDQLSLSEVDPLDAARDVHTQLWFVAGYGLSRILPDPNWTPPLVRPSIERLMPLFDPRVNLTSTSFANHFLAKDAKEGRASGTTSRLYSKMLNQALKVGGKSLLPDIENFELRGYGGTKTAKQFIESDRFSQRMGPDAVAISGTALSHGYQSTFAWIADLIGHVLLESKNKLETSEMEGLVLLDEIDLYLHPTWQATFVSALRKVFPRMQFIATTHSPVVLAGLAPHEIVRLTVDPSSGDVVRGAWDSTTGKLVAAGPGEIPQPDPRSMTGSELYRTWFALDRLTPNPLGEALRQFQVLVSDPAKTKEDKNELERLRKKLSDAGVNLDEISK